MGSASLIASAIALLLLVITAYVLVGWTLATAEIVGFAQQEQTLRQEARLHTGIAITGTSLTVNGTPLTVEVENTGSEIIRDFDKMDVYLAIAGGPSLYSPGDGSPGTWEVTGFAPDSVHPGSLDPGEVMTIAVSYSGETAPVWVQVTTPNGISDSAYV